MLETQDDLRIQGRTARQFVKLCLHMITNYVWVELAYAELMPDSASGLLHNDPQMQAWKMNQLKSYTRTIYAAEQYCTALGDHWEAVRGLLVGCHSSRFPQVRETMLELVEARFDCGSSHFKEVQNMLYSIRSVAKHTKSCAEDVLGMLKDSVRQSKRRTMSVHRLQWEV
eukprot:12422222-Karenia_brevis.AAC.1